MEEKQRFEDFDWRRIDANKDSARFAFRIAPLYLFTVWAMLNSEGIATCLKGLL